MTRIFWDTHVFLYLFEGGTRADEVKRLRERMIVRRDRLFTSGLTLGEVLVRPMGVSPGEAAVFEAAVARAATVLPFDAAAASHYARLRNDRSLAVPDAMQLACAASAQIDMFITSDDRLASYVVPGVKFITPLSRAIL